MAGYYGYDQAGTLHWFPIDDGFYHAVTEIGKDGRGAIRPISDPPSSAEVISRVGRCPHCGELVRWPSRHLSNECQVVRIPNLYPYPPEKEEHRQLEIQAK